MMIILVAGSTGSGKSSAASLIAAHENGSVVHISADSYYRRKSSYPLNSVPNYDIPDAIEHHLLTEHITRLKAGEMVDVPVYDFTIHDRKPEKVRIHPAPIVIVDGIFVLGIKELRDLADFSIFISASEEMCLARRLARNAYRQARSDGEDVAYFKQFVTPSNKNFVEPSRAFADVVIENDGDINALKWRISAICATRVSRVHNTACPITSF